jgi:hypothetical protein
LPMSGEVGEMVTVSCALATPATRAVDASAHASPAPTDPRNRLNPFSYFFFFFFFRFQSSEAGVGSALPA